MKTVLVKYEVWVDGGHPLLDDGFVRKSKVVKVIDLEQLNGMFEHIIDIKILEP